MIKDYLRKDLVGFKPYHAPDKAYEVKIDANENPFEHCPEVIEKIKAWLQDKDHMTRYPDTDNNKLREKISSTYGVTKSNVICTVGSDQLIEYIIKTFIEPGDLILVPNPSFSMYELSCTLNHGKTILYELKDDFSYNVKEIIKLYQEFKPKIVFICTPNNPTGSTISKAAMLELLEVVKCPVVIDEAYAEFINESMIDEINKYPQMIILKTFSKAFGLAGLRVGFGIASEEMIEMINISKSPYNLSSFSSEMAGLVLENLDYYLNLVKSLQSNRDELFEQLKTISCLEAVYPSKANFILVKSKNSDLAHFLEDHKILVRGYGQGGRLGNCIRLTVGTQLENEQLIKVLKKYKG